MLTLPTNTCTMLQDAREEAAPLFGRGDHSAQEQALSVRDRCDLLMRASFLVTVFLPFLLLGPILLLLASQFAPSAPAQAQAAARGAAAGNPGTSDLQVEHTVCCLMLMLLAFHVSLCLSPCLSVCLCVCMCVFVCSAHLHTPKLPVLLLRLLTPIPLINQ